MPQLTIARIRNLVRALDYAVSVHAAEELEDDNLTILDLENILLTGKIIERQREPHTREIKAVVRGHSLDAVEAESVVKLGHNGTLVVITVYLII